MRKGEAKAALEPRYPSCARLGVIVFGLLCLLSPASADSEQQLRHYELWAGADATEGSWLAYTGATYAPFGDIHSQGFKLRAASGYGRYRVWNPWLRDFEDNEAETYFLDGLAGYLFRFDPVIAKLFVGISAIDHSLPDNVSRLVAERKKLGVVDGQQVGLKIQAEFWLNIDQYTWASLDLSWSSAHNTRSARFRQGYKFLPDLSVGFEASINADEQVFCQETTDGACIRLTEQQALQNSLINNGRLGVFVRHDWDGGELSAAIGLLGEERQLYGKMNYLFQF
jgi:cellulose biosynthesis protein BcsS